MPVPATVSERTGTRIAWPHALRSVIPSKGGACCATALCCSTMPGPCYPAATFSSLLPPSVLPGCASAAAWPDRPGL